jgi:conjugal transfer pilus assembly protein TraV
MNTLIKGSLIATAVTLLSGCSTLSGFDASSDFACKAQPGVSCQSVTGVHQNAMLNNLPSQQTEGLDESELDELNEDDNDDSSWYSVEPEPESQPQPELPSKSSAISGQAIESGTPLYQKASTLRVWSAPWEDKNQVLHDQSYSYLLIEKAKWEVEHFKDAKYRSGFSINP